MGAVGAVDAEWENEHLWLYLLALDFDTWVEDFYLELETTAFHTPNRSAFHATALFLFSKLDCGRAEETFRDFIFPLENSAEPQFRKQCCIWLKEIANAKEGCLPMITPSSLLCPGGPKFIELYYQFARHVMIEDLKRISVGTDMPFAEDEFLGPIDEYLTNARCRIACNKLLQSFQKEDFVAREYEKKARLLIKETKRLKREYTVLWIKSYQKKENDQYKNDKIDKNEKIQKVRSMWTLVMETLKSLKKEKEVVDSVLNVLNGSVDQCSLDGASVVLRVPRMLTHRVQSDIHQLCTGNLYEAGKLNVLTVIQVLNEALRALRDEYHQSELKPQLKDIEVMVTVCNTLIQKLKAKSLVIEEQLQVSRSQSSRREEDWQVKWRKFLGLCPFSAVICEDPEFDLRALSSCSFDVAEEDLEYSVFSEHLVSASDIYNSVHEVYDEKDDRALETVLDKSMSSPRWISSVPLELSEASKNQDVFIEKNLHIETCKGKENLSPPKILNGKAESAISEMQTNASEDGIQVESPVRKEDPLEKALDELSGEVARTVMSESPQSGEGKGLSLEDLISLTIFDPFLTRKQIPRTPENLLTEIRSSWRKAIQTGGSSDLELDSPEVSQLEVSQLKESSMNAALVMQEVPHSTFMCSVPASPVPDFDPPLSERKSQLSSTEFRPEEQMMISNTIDSTVLETSEVRESESTEAQELKCVLLNESSVEDPEEQTFQYAKSLDATHICSEDNSETVGLPSDIFQRSSVNELLHWNVLPLLGSLSHEAGSLGILDETLPKEFDDIDPNISTKSESDFDELEDTYVPDDSKNEGDTEKSQLDLQSLFTTDKELKESVSGIEEELHQTHSKDVSVSCRSDPSLAAGKGERDELCNPVEVFSLDAEFTKTPSPTSHNEKKYSLPSLLVNCQRLEEMASVIQDIPLDLMCRVKDKEQLNEKPGMKEPSSG